VGGVVFGVFVLFCFLHNTAPATFRHGIIISGSPASCLEPNEPAFDLPSVLGVVCDNSTMAAECQDPVFLIGPRNKKTGKKRPTIKILYPPVQITSQGF
jgi:hypothetical protein